MPTNAGSQTNDQSDEHMHGAAIIDDQGKETPITDDMIESVLQGILKTTQS
jgi:hypothetical protein